VTGALLSPGPVVQVVDGSGNPVAGARTIQVTLNSGSGALSGTTSVNTGAGSTATFSNLIITGSGTHTLLFSSGGLTSVTSGDILVTAGTTTVLSADPVSSVVGQEVTFTAEVQSSVGSPTGQVSFRDNGTEIGVGTLSGGIATFITTELSEGPHQITAHYAGEGGFQASTSSVLDYQVSAANIPPSAQEDAFSVDEDGTITVGARGVLTNDDDPDGDDAALTAIVVTGPAQDPNFTLSADGSFTYTPNPDFNGTDTFTYQANDGQAISNVATVTITVNPVNDPPTFTTQGDVSTSSLISSVVGQTHGGWVTGIDPGPPDEEQLGQTVQFQVSTDNDAAFQDPPQIDTSGDLTYRPQLTVSTIVVNAGVLAQDSGGATSGQQTFTITINP
jgi:VCBS repeat-containing protein